MIRLPFKPTKLFFDYLKKSFYVTASILVLTYNILFEFPLLRRAEQSLIDQGFNQRGPDQNLKKRSKVVIVEINDRSNQALLKTMPYPRSYYARLIRNLKLSGAKAVGIDINFTRRDSGGIRQDNEFRRALKEAGNVVLAGKIPEDENSNVTIREHFQNYGNDFIDSASRFGIVNIDQDVGGVERRYRPFVYDGSQQRLIPTFAMAILNVYFNKAPYYLASIEDRDFQYLDRSIPKFDTKSFLINYYGPSHTFPRINFADVIDDKDFKTADELKYGLETNTFDNPKGYLHDGTFRGKIVIVGSTNPLDKDMYPTSIGIVQEEADNKDSGEEARNQYGVEIHANVIQSILDNNFIVRQPLWMSAFIIYGLSLFTFVFIAELKKIRIKSSWIIELLGVALILAELFMIYWAFIQLFIRNNFLADMTSPFLAVIVCYIYSTVDNYLSERKQKVLIKGMFSRYVNPTIVDELVANPEKLKLGGERKELSVFFSDIENFTKISESMQPEDLVTVLNEYLSVMTQIILSNNGTLDKYEGDAIVAFWGAPIAQPDHARRACRTAVQMQGSLKGMRQLWEGEGKPPLCIRIGINTGDMIVGNMGGATRFDYTVIGDSVNLGARLEGANKQYNTEIMISESTYKEAQGSVFARELDMLVVAGKTEPIRVYELMGMLDEEIPPEQLKLVELYTRGLKHYRQRQWQPAIKLFEEALEVVPEDYPSQLYIERSHLYIASPPPDSWNGVFILRTK